MRNKRLWLVLFIVTAVYLNIDLFKEWDKKIEQLFSTSSKVKNTLNLIKTSPRWKYPYSFYNAKINKDGLLEFPESTLPILSIETKEESFFSYTSGIYRIGIEEWQPRSAKMRWWQYPANYKNRGSDWERNASISFIGFSEKVDDFNVGIRINGNATRAYPQKSLRLIFRERRVANSFFKDDSALTYKTILLRNGGNDWDRAFMRDVLSQCLSKNLNVETQAAKAVNVFLNGEYWGIHYLRPKIDDEYLASKYTIESSDVSILEAPLNLYRGDSIGLEQFKAFLSLLNETYSSDSLLFSVISDNMDITSFIDYLIIQSFIANTDWPQNNWMLWKDLSGKINGGRWKWILKDTDYGFGFYSARASKEDMIKKIVRSNGVISKIFKSLSENSIFIERYNQRFDHFIKTEWNKSNYYSTVDSLESSLFPEMKHQINRWRTHSSIKDWKQEVKSLRDFYDQRINHFKGLH